MTTEAIPGQPLTTLATSASFQPGPGTYARGGVIYASVAGPVLREGGMIQIGGTEDALTVPKEDSLVIGTVLRINRQAATISILTVDGRPCRHDFMGLIRNIDVRKTNKDAVKIWNCFRPGDVVRAKVISLGDVRSYFLSTASNSLGVLYAVSSTSGSPLEAISWEEMQDPTTGEVEMRKVAGPE